MKFKSNLVAASMAGLLASSVDARVCRALAMSGGGSNGAWEAGVLNGFAVTGNPSDFYYDVVSGISAGALNTAGLAGFAPEEFVEAA
jgi:predicted acylesterase/phospholipase RssA